MKKKLTIIILLFVLAAAVIAGSRLNQESVPSAQSNIQQRAGGKNQ